MNLNLDRRYRTLFAAYGVGGGELLWRVKAKIAGGMLGGPPLLRPDAAHFLLVNFDHMVLRPISGIVPQPAPPFIEPEPYVIDPAQASAAVERSLAIILNRLTARPGHPLSAHSVLLTVHEVWPELGAQFGWS